MPKVAKATKWAKDYAFGKYINSEAQRGGELLAEKAAEEIVKRKKNADKDIQQSAKDVASYFSAKVRGRVQLSGQTYCCFNCLYNKKGYVTEDNKPVCVVCQNGSHFVNDPKQGEAGKL